MISLRSSFQSREFSCQVPSVEFGISADRARVTVTVKKGDYERDVYDEYLYPDSDDRIVLTDVDRLLEPYANRWLLFSLTVLIVEERVTADSSGNEVVTQVDSRQLTTEVVYCSANILNMTASNWLEKRFLCLMDGTRTTALGWQERLCYIGNDTAKCKAWYDDGSSRTVDVPGSTGNDCIIIDTSSSNFLTSGLKLMRYTITAGSRTMDYEVDYDVEPEVAPVLLFWNSFGVQELAYCTGELKQASSFGRSQTRIGRTMTTYDMQEKESFKADTGILSFPMANWWREVLRSRDIRLCTVYGGEIWPSGKPVIITSEKMELSNTPEHLPRITFEYEYADRNHNIFDVRAEGRIFDDTFDYTFN